ncbi:hypothetical protein Sjap_001529 [Stephania japonica]|uniref:PRA1 family protein n=1 Tax=Stephania japonica TaxID=461633 RepID=A0AAP0KME9_9MAGN
MASSATTIPTSTTSTTANTDSAAAPIATPALRAFLSRLSASLRRSLSNRRPWTELLDRSAFSRPISLSDGASRLRKNLSYFRTNYAALLGAVLALSLLSHPLSLLLLLSLLAAWLFLYLFRPSDHPLVILGRPFSDRETLALLLLLTLFVVFLTSVGSLLISALMVGTGIVCLHGAFRVPEDLFLDDQDGGVGVGIGIGIGAGGSGLLSFLGGAATSAAAAATAAAAPPLASRV